MGTYLLAEDVHVLCITASSFPAGVKQAHQALHSIVPPGSGREYFGLSRPHKGNIVYKAAAEVKHAGEAEEKGCEAYTIRQGNYISIVVNDFMTDLPAIGLAFQQLLQHPGLDPDGCCVEWYFNDKDVRCMVRLA